MASEFKERDEMRKYTVSKAFKDLGNIDKAHESGRITQRQHDSRSKKVLKRLTKK